MSLLRECRSPAWATLARRLPVVRRRGGGCLRRGDGAALARDGRCRAARLLQMLQGWRRTAKAIAADEREDGSNEDSGARRAALWRAEIGRLAASSSSGVGRDMALHSMPTA